MTVQLQKKNILLAGVGKLVQELRLSKGISSKAMASKLKIRESLLLQLESGKYSMTVMLLSDIAEILETTAAKILAEIEDGAIRASGKNRKKVKQTSVKVRDTNLSTDLTFEIARVIRDVRIKNECSQEELAAKTNLHTYISDVEGGTRNLTFNSFIRICCALNISASQVLRLAEQLKAE